MSDETKIQYPPQPTQSAPERAAEFRARFKVGPQPEPPPTSSQPTYDPAYGPDDPLREVFLEALEQADKNTPITFEGRAWKRYAAKMRRLAGSMFKLSRRNHPGLTDFQYLQIENMFVEHVDRVEKLYVELHPDWEPTKL